MLELRRYTFISQDTTIILHTNLYIYRVITKEVDSLKLYKIKSVPNATMNLIFLFRYILKLFPTASHLFKTIS